MKSRDFCYWLQGFFEIASTTSTGLPIITAEQAEVIQRHLSLVFLHEIDPSQGSAEHQAELQNTHDGQPKIGGQDKDGKLMRC